MDIRPVITPTSLNTFSDCRLQWKWYQSYSTKSRSFNLDLGIGIHAALDAYYTSRMKKQSKRSWKIVDPVAFFVDWCLRATATVSLENGDDMKALMDARTLGESMLIEYMKHYGTEPFDVIAVEQVVQREVPGTDWHLEARIDAVIRLHSGSKPVFVLEHKTFSQLDVSQLDRDHQFVAEAWLAEKLTDLPVSGVIYNGLRKQIATPRVKAPLFQRHHIYVNDAQIETLLKRCRGMVHQLTQGGLVIFPEPGMMKCRFCSYKEPCLAWMRGEDYQFLLDNQYRLRVHSPIEEEQVVE